MRLGKTYHSLRFQHLLVLFRTETVSVGLEKYLSLPVVQFSEITRGWVRTGAVNASLYLCVSVPKFGVSSQPPKVKARSKNS